VPGGNQRLNWTNPKKTVNNLFNKYFVGNPNFPREPAPLIYANFTLFSERNGFFID
jgi:hypothetical protein